MAETQAVAVRSKAEEVKKYIQTNIGAVKEALPRVGLTPESLTRTALSQIYRNPLLMECDKTSLMRSIVEAASLGLSFSLGRAYLVPFKNKVKGKDGREMWRMEATLIPGYQGLADVARRSGEISSINAQAVYSGDEFRYEFGLKEDTLQHKPIGEPDPKKVTHAYAIVRFKDGGYQVRVMTRKQIDAVRQMSKSPNSMMWAEHFDEAAIKTVVKRVLKLCPASPELVRAIELDNRQETGEPPSVGSSVFPDDDPDIIDVTLEGEPVEEKPTRTATVKDALRGSKKAADSAIHAVDAPSASEVLIADLGAMIEDYGWNPSRVDIEISAALAGKIQSFTKLADAGTVDQIKAVMTHFKAVKDEGNR